MTSWKRVVGVSALFVAMAATSFAAEGAGAAAGAGPGAGAGRGRGMMGRFNKAATTMVAKLVAKEVGLAADKTEAFVAAVVGEREAFSKKTAEAMKSGDREAMRGLFSEREKGMQAVLEAKLTPEQVKKATELMAMGRLENSVGQLLDAKIEEPKVEKALPILVKYQKSNSELMTKMRANEVSQEDAMAKMKEMRANTAKELAPIIGEAAATKWSESAGFGGGRGRRGEGGGAGGGATAP